jgi:hypothetical protein
MNSFFEKKYLFILSMWKLTIGYSSLGQPSFNANQCWLSLPVDLLEEFGGKKPLQGAKIS